ncbi:basic proline-rich protein-like [Canis lupus dingo]|uniref:basic proline-rich protein-like n=1 Tax=Canis lupus dingo TaxID=286419 RepID=UPI0020C51FFC|nr:basic proline-rich protein-like [Canis lupus dingo]
MARPPAISMHRARGASVPSRRRRRIRRPGRARRAAARQPGPRRPRARPAAPIVPGPRRPPPRAAPRSPAPARSPQPAARPTARLRKLGPAPPARPGARELGESRGAPRPGPPPQGVGAPRPGALSVSPRTKVPRGARRGRGDPVLPALPGRVRWLLSGRPASGGQGRRGLARASPGRPRPPAVPPCPELREVAPRARRRPARGRGARPGPGPGPGPGPSGQDSAAPSASRRVPPPRAGRSTCVSRVTAALRSRRLLRMVAHTQAQPAALGEFVGSKKWVKECAFAVITGL